MMANHFEFLIHTESTKAATGRPGEMVGHSRQDAEAAQKSRYYPFCPGPARFRLYAQLFDVR